MMAKCCWIVSRAPEFSRLSHFSNTFSQQQQQQQLRSGLWGWHSDQPFSLSILPNLANDLVAAAFQIEIKQASQTKIRRKRKKKTSAPFTQVSLSVAARISAKITQVQSTASAAAAAAVFTELFFPSSRTERHSGLQDDTHIGFPFRKVTWYKSRPVRCLISGCEGKQFSFGESKTERSQSANHFATFSSDSDDLLPPSPPLLFHSSNFLPIPSLALFNSSLFLPAKKVISPLPSLFRTQTLINHRRRQLLFQVKLYC